MKKRKTTTEAKAHHETTERSAVAAAPTGYGNVERINVLEKELAAEMEAGTVKVFRFRRQEDEYVLATDLSSAKRKLKAIGAFQDEGIVPKCEIIDPRNIPRNAYTWTATAKARELERANIKGGWDESIYPWDFFHNTKDQPRDP